MQATLEVEPADKHLSLVLRLGLVIGPALILLAKFQPQTATGTSLGALLLPVGALGAWEYYRRGHLDIAASLWIAQQKTNSQTQHWQRRHVVQKTMKQWITHTQG